MKMPNGRYAGHELCTIPLQYIDWFQREHSPVVAECQRILKIKPIWKRLFFRDLSNVLNRFKCKYSDNGPVQDLIIEIKKMMEAEK